MFSSCSLYEYGYIYLNVTPGRGGSVGVDFLKCKVLFINVLSYIKRGGSGLRSRMKKGAVGEKNGQNFR